jgi:LAGLIDADG DNA endonuclease family protein
MGGANQQERLSYSEEARYFLAGFIEGEGALCVSIKQHPTSRFGFLVDPEFFLYQHTSGRRILELAREIFQTGRIFPKPGNPKVLVYSIVSRRSLFEKVVPFFERYVVPFSCKWEETFERFREILEMMDRKEHLTSDGLVRIVEKAYAMNPYSKGRERLRPLHVVCERILRGHTPDIPVTG